MLVEVAERAMAHCEKRELLLGGGVCCNKRLQEMCAKMCKGRDAELFVPENRVLTDNAIMIAWQGILEHKKREPLDKIDILPNWRTDDVKVSWR
jgi:tRNA A37 threonylcarbamoyltransferase TsaD